jgi:hypothetical protein
MDTPEPAQGSSAPLYGGRGARINRRTLLGCGVLLPIAARASVFGPPDLLERAIVAMGGRTVLARVKALRWTGTARVESGGQMLEIEVNTRVEPFVRARSETKLAGTTDVRTLILEPEGGWVERNGTRTPLPAAQTEHERQQYGLYGYMLLVAVPPPGPCSAIGLVAERPGLPPDRRLLLEGDYL